MQIRNTIIRGNLCLCMLLLLALDAAGQVSESMARFAGNWIGEISIPGVEMSMRVTFDITYDDENGLTASFGSPDQVGYDVPVDSVLVDDYSIRMTVMQGQIEYEGMLGLDSQGIAGNLKQSGLTIPLDLQRSEGLEKLARPQDPLPPFPYLSEDVTFENAEAGVTLAGTLTIPSSGMPAAVVILISGSGPQNRDSELWGTARSWCWRTI